MITKSKILIMVLGGLLSLLLGGCPENETNFRFNLVIVDKPGCTRAAESKQSLLSGSYTMRLTFMRRENGASIGESNLRKFELLCDRVIKKGEKIELLLPQKNISSPAVRVEVFDQEKLLFFSQTTSISLANNSATIFLRPTGLAPNENGLSCVDPARRYRAFHSATLLPNGQVIIVGGLGADPTEGASTDLLDLSTEEAYAVKAVEIYDPSTMSFLVINTPSDFPGRAFHQAALLPSPPQGPYKILLVGGVKKKADAATANPLVIRSRNPYPFLFTPTASAEAAEAGLIIYNLTSSPPSMEYKVLPKLPKALFPMGTYNDKGTEFAIVGGGSAYDSTAATHGFTGDQSLCWLPLNEAELDKVDIANITSMPQINLNRTHVGHGFTRLGAARYWVYGGNMTGAIGEVAQMVQFGNVQVNTPALTPAQPALAWITMTSIGSSDDQLVTQPPTRALIAGGYQLTDETATVRAANKNPAATALRLFKDDATASVMDVAASNEGFQAVGYHEAVRLYNGQVLLSGGNYNCNEIPFCAHSQMRIYQLVGNDSLSQRSTPAVPELAVKRYGHRMTRLLDNTVLITGGITFTQNDAEQRLLLLNQAELFNPRTGESSEDYPFLRNPPSENDPQLNKAATACKTSLNQ